MVRQLRTWIILQATQKMLQYLDALWKCKQIVLIHNSRCAWFSSISARRYGQDQFRGCGCCIHQRHAGKGIRYVSSPDLIADMPLHDWFTQPAISRLEASIIVSSSVALVYGFAGEGNCTLRVQMQCSLIVHSHSLPQPSLESFIDTEREWQSLNGAEVNCLSQIGPI